MSAFKYKHLFKPLKIAIYASFRKVDTVLAAYIYKKYEQLCYVNSTMENNLMYL